MRFPLPPRIKRGKIENRLYHREHHPKQWNTNRRGERWRDEKPFHSLPLRSVAFFFLLLLWCCFSFLGLDINWYGSEKRRIACRRTRFYLLPYYGFHSFLLVFVMVRFIRLRLGCSASVLHTKRRFFLLLLLLLLLFSCFAKKKSP